MTSQPSQQHAQREIVIESNTIPLEELKQHLESAALTDITLETQEEASKTRIGITEAVLVAIISASGPAIAALVKSLFQYFSSRSKNAKIIVETNGVRIEVPSNISDERLKSLIDRLNKETKTWIILP